MRENEEGDVKVSEMREKKEGERRKEQRKSRKSPRWGANAEMAALVARSRERQIYSLRGTRTTVSGLVWRGGWT